MVERAEANQENLKEWLLEFERHIGKDVVVSLLISKGKIEFVGVLDRKRYLGGEEEEPDDEEPDLSCLKNKGNIHGYSLMDIDKLDYFG